MSGTEYDAEHRRLRAALIAHYEARGRRGTCLICGDPLDGTPPADLHVAHVHHRGDHRRRAGGRGLAHARCNTGDAGRLAQHRLRGRDPNPRPRRQW